MNDISAFSSDYFEARDKFLRAASARGLDILTKELETGKGPDGEPLYSDIAHMGPRDAPLRLLMISATHGIEGYCGSACQTAFLGSNQSILERDDLSVTLLHAHNPYGFAWGRRVNEDNVDQNRNFIDFTSELPVNEGYQEIRDGMVPKGLSKDHLKNASRAISNFGKAHGFDRIQEAITRGQYHDADGLYYGGKKPTWSNVLFRKTCQKYMIGAERAALIDYHTGLGPYGFGEIITEYELHDPAYKRAQDWYGGDITSTIGGDSSSAALVGTTDLAFHAEMKDTPAVAIALEFGTQNPDDVFAATRADNWIHLHEEQGSPQWAYVKQQIRDAFYPEKYDWKEMILKRSEDVIAMTLNGLTKKGSR